MKNVLMNNSNGKNQKNIMPLEDKAKKQALKEEKEKEEEKKEEEPEKEVDIAEVNIQDDDLSRELKKKTDVVFKGYMKTTPPIPLTYIGFEKDMNAVVEGVLNEQDKKKKQDKKNSRREKLRELRKKLFKGKNR